MHRACRWWAASRWMARGITPPLWPRRASPEPHPPPPPPPPTPPQPPLPPPPPSPVG
jgi:hypothetical protein